MIAIGFFMSAKARESTIVAPKADSLAPSPPPTFTRSPDLYYRYNFANPQAAPWNNYTSFTGSQNSFELGKADIKYDQGWGKAVATYTF